MWNPISGDARPALDLALTTRRGGPGGQGGVADGPDDPAGLTVWVRAHPDTVPDAAGFVPDEAAVRDLRAAVHALFAHAVRPAEPSPADAVRLVPVPDASRRLNAAAARRPPSPCRTTGPRTPNPSSASGRAG